jgi:hypothetical protein
VHVLRSVTAVDGGFGSMARQTEAAPYRGRRLRLRAQVRTEDVVRWAGLWMRVDDADGVTLAFDNMQDRPFRGTADWTSASVVLDVAPEARTIVYGMLLAGTGTARAGAIVLEPVDEATPPTRPPGIPGWLLGGTRLDAYQVAAVGDERPGGGRAALVRSVADPGAGACELGQVVEAASGPGGTACLRASLRGRKVSGAALWLRVLDGRMEELAADLMEDRSLTGTFDWRELEVSLPVPPEAAFVGFGAVLHGTGELWVADVRFELDGGTGDGGGQPLRGLRNLDFCG